MPGFGPPKFWIQIVHTDAPDKWERCNGTQAQAYKAAAEATQDPAVDFVLVLEGAVREGTVPRKAQILADFQTAARPGTKLYKLEVKR